MSEHELCCVDIAGTQTTRFLQMNLRADILLLLYRYLVVAIQNSYNYNRLMTWAQATNLQHVRSLPADFSHLPNQFLRTQTRHLRDCLSGSAASYQASLQCSAEPAAMLALCHSLQKGRCSRPMIALQRLVSPPLRHEGSCSWPLIPQQTMTGEPPGQACCTRGAPAVQLLWRC